MMLESLLNVQVKIQIHVKFVALIGVYNMYK